MANAGQLYLGDDSGFNRQLDWRHKIIDQDKQDRIEVANQLRDDVLTLGAKVSHNIERYGFGPSVDDDGKYIGRGTGGRDLEVMKRTVEERDRNFKLKHNEAIINAGMKNIAMAKAHDLSERWYHADPVALEKRHAEGVKKIMEDMGNYLPYQKIERYPFYYKEGLLQKIKDIRKAQKDGKITEKQMTDRLEAIHETPLVFTQYARRNKLVNEKYVNTFPQATIALRKRMVDMNYIDGNLFADTRDNGLENVDEVFDGGGEDSADSNQGGNNNNLQVGGNEGINSLLQENDSDADKNDDSTSLSGPLLGTDAAKKYEKTIITGYTGTGRNRRPITKVIKTDEPPTFQKFLNLFKTDKPKEIIGWRGRTPIYKGDDSKPKTKSGSILSNTAQAATLPMTARMKKKVQYEGGIEKTDGKLYIDGGDISFPGGINAGSWAYGKKPEDKRMFARLLAQDDNGKIDESLASNILDVLNTQAGTGGEAANARMKKFGTGNWDNIQISKRGMVSGMKFISKHNLSELVRTNSFLKDPNTAGRELNQKLPKDFRDMIEDFTYRFGGGAFSGSDSLKTPNKEKLPFEKTLKAIVEAKTKEERVAALYKFRDLFKLTRVYKNERKSDRIQDAIKTIDALAWKAAQGGW